MLSWIWVQLFTLYLLMLSFANLPIIIRKILIQNVFIHFHVKVTALIAYHSIVSVRSHLRSDRSQWRGGVDVAVATADETTVFRSPITMTAPGTLRHGLPTVLLWHFHKTLICRPKQRCEQNTWQRSNNIYGLADNARRLINTISLYAVIRK